MPVNDNNPGRNTSGGIAPRGDEHIRAAIENAEGASDEGDKGGGDGVSPLAIIFLFSLLRNFPPL